MPSAGIGDEPSAGIAEVPATGRRENNLAARSTPSARSPGDAQQQPPESDAALDGDLQRGTKLEAQWGQRWLPVTVKRVLPDGTVEVHWEGYSNGCRRSIRWNYAAFA
jgi:hypothetical protein